MLPVAALSVPGLALLTRLALLTERLGRLIPRLTVTTRAVATLAIPRLTRLTVLAERLGGLVALLTLLTRLALLTERLGRLIPRLTVTPRAIATLVRRRDGTPAALGARGCTAGVPLGPVLVRWLAHRVSLLFTFPHSVLLPHRRPGADPASTLHRQRTGRIGLTST
ncbi:MAG TPA: hypothetical protein VK095_14945 [Beutenbergiaceae bacterium]|nr:hypothetical protein [Beutenbergiaceae bacterium]